MSLLANGAANPAAAIQAGGVEFAHQNPQRMASGVSVALVLLLHAIGIYLIATWSPESAWMRLWRPVQVKLIQEEPVRPPEIKPVEEPPPPPPPPPKPRVIEQKSPPLPPPAVKETPAPASPPAPIMTAAPEAPAPSATFSVPPQPAAVPVEPPAPKTQVVAAPPAPKTISKIEFVRAPSPNYPALSRRLGEQGKVLVRALVDESGHAIDVSVQESSGKPRLDEAAKKAVMDALFKPYREDGKVEQVYVVVPVIFRMES